MSISGCIIEAIGHDRAGKDYGYLQQKTCEVRICERKTSEQQKKKKAQNSESSDYMVCNSRYSNFHFDSKCICSAKSDLGVTFSAMGTASLLNGIDSFQKVEREARKKEKAEKGEYNPNFVANGGDRTFRWLNSPLAVILKSIGLMLIGMVMILMPLFVKGQLLL